LVGVFLAALVFALFMLPLLMGALTIFSLTRPPCAPGGTPAAFAPDYESITFASTNGLPIEGYFLPGSNGATVIIPPAFNGGRGAQLGDAAIFHQAGFNVLTFDSRACTRLRQFSLGYYEVEDVLAARDYLIARPDVDPARISLHGFSSAGATALMTAERSDDFRAVSAMGGYHDYAAELGLGEPADFFSTLYRWGVAGGYHLFTGNDITRLSPYNGLAQLNETPVLLIYGSLETTLPGARRMLARGQELGLSIDLWVVEGAGHGDYHLRAPGDYARRLTAFHLRALGVE
jgi:dipeptidyl aminopeptidase/acylaminoacyl peptidase